ncbi:MFS transporter [Agrococcus baldri]|uniref:Putative proline/betaine transporter n=1 Tax=Agrococcus baldri TaxID=153730 RepID=A0AA87UWM2_9MICO|nr:MFS transporter [Agrococcus baldri]GEK79577.1 MFS transporter [Agrococcus baldri]
MTATTAPVSPHRRALKSGTAALVGTTIEWYDFYVYATAAAIVFPHVFFPEAEPAIGTLASFATFAVAFFVRPLGGIIFGHIGDRIGRKPALTITLLLMGVATVLVGLVPDYSTIGVTAAILLIVLRVCQGLAVGGEWGGASLMAVESAPEKWKTFYGGFTQLGNPLGALLATGAFWILSAMGDDVLLTWGWRVPFLASVVLIAVGFWVRYRVEETPVFEAKVQERQQSTPIVFALKNNWYPMLLGFGLVAIPSGGYYFATTYVQSYAVSEQVGLDPSIILGAMTVASFVEALVTLPLAALGDKWGRKLMMYLGVGLSVVIVLPLILAIDNHDVTMIYVLVSAIRLTMSATWAPLSALMAQMFRPQSRYTSMSLSYGTGAAVFGGLTPIAATGLFALTGNIWAVVGLFAFLGLVAWVSTWLAPQHSDEAAVTQSLEPRLDTTAIRTDKAD